MPKSHPSRSFHIVVDEPIRVPIYETITGRGKFTYITLEPGEDYSLDNEPVYGNKDFIKSLEKYEIRKSYNERLEEKLKRLGVNYKSEFCKSCGGRVKKLIYKPVEIIA